MLNVLTVVCVTKYKDIVNKIHLEIISYSEEKQQVVVKKKSSIA